MNIYQIRIALQHISPPIWRLLQVPADITLGRLHRVLQVAMGWTDSHLHQFITEGVAYGVPDEQFPNEMKSERNVWLDSLVGPGDRLVYEYDFGDDWMHEITIEKTLTAEPGKHYPCCIGGARACPPEDCGGPSAYEKLCAAFADPKNEEHDELLESLGDDFDPEVFDPAAVNAALHCLT